MKSYWIPSLTPITVAATASVNSKAKGTATNRSHLQLLSRLSFALHEDKLREAVVRQAPHEEILREVRRVEAGMAAPAPETGKVAH